MLRRLVLAAGWALAGGLAFTTVMRFTHLDVHSTFLIATTTGAPVLLLLAWPLAFLALALAERRLALTAIALIVVGLATVAPLVGGGRGLTAAQRAPAAVDLRVLALNVEYDHDTGPAVTRQVRSAHPDVVVLSELSQRSMVGLDLSQYAYSYVHLPHLVSGSGIWSRYPLLDGHDRQVGILPMGQARLVLPDGRSVTILQVHTTSPTSAYARPRWRHQLSVLRSELQEAKGLTIMAGDFNASRSDPGFADLLGGPLHIADAADGRGLLPTWPSSKWWTPPVLRLDHILVSGEFGVQRARVLGPTGGDHRAVVADLRVAAYVK